MAQWRADALAARESLASRPECRAIRADPFPSPWGRGGLWRSCSACSEAPKCFSRAFCSPIPDRTRAPESPPLLHTAREGLVETRRERLGRTWYVAACTPHRLLSAMLLLFVMSGRHCKHCCLCQSLGSRSPCSIKACWQHYCPCPSFPLIQIFNSPAALDWYLACS